MNDIEQATETEFDVVVIGGGCVGTAVAMFAAGDGLKTALLEKTDFGAGTSGASSEIIHGGLQYLSMLRFHIVRQSNEYAGRIYRSARHLCMPLPIVFPSYKRGPIPFAALRALMRIYDRYNRRYKGAPLGAKLSAAEVAELIPTVQQTGLLGGVKYYEWWIDAPRMCLGCALSAAQHGAFVRNHAAVAGLEKRDDGRWVVRVDDERTGEQVSLRSRVVINASGPWTDRVCKLAGLDEPPRVRPTRGAHIILSKKISNTGLVLHFVDGRYGIVLPKQHYSMIGTTDDDYYGDLDTLAITEDEVGYLLEGTARYVSDVAKEDIADWKVGVRPTVYKYGQTEDKLPRDHQVDDHAESKMPGLISVYGGKLATATLMAEDTLKVVGKYLEREIAPPADYRLPGGPDSDVENYLKEVVGPAAEQYGVEEATVDALVRRYGTEFEEVLGLTKERPELGENLGPADDAGEPMQRVLAAEVCYTVGHEWVLTVEDFVRRTGLGTGLPSKEACLKRVAQMLRTEPCPTTT